jgi:hypothetical protein
MILNQFWELIIMSKITYVESQKNKLAILASNGWTVKGNLKIPYATSDFSKVRLYFKPRAIYVDYGKPYDLKTARTLTYDTDYLKSMSDKEFLVLANSL